MKPVEAAVKLLDAMKTDPVLARSVQRMVKLEGHEDIYEWCSANPDMSIALAEQLIDVDGQIDNMSYLLSQGDLS